MTTSENVHNHSECARNRGMLAGVVKGGLDHLSRKKNSLLFFFLARGELSGWLGNHDVRRKQ